MLLREALSSIRILSAFCRGERKRESASVPNSVAEDIVVQRILLEHYLVEELRTDFLRLWRCVWFRYMRGLA